MFNANDFPHTDSFPSDISYPMPNSEQIFHCWQFMIDSSNKTFEKSLSVDLAPRDTIQLGAVIKSPCINKEKRLFAAIRITLAEDDLMSSLIDKSHDTMVILTKAGIITPKLECCKELFHEQAGLKVIPLVAKLDTSRQRLRIPFKNNGTKDLDLRLDVTGFPGKETLADYKCIPENTRIPSNSLGYITIAMSIWQDNIKNEQCVLIVKIKDTLMIYSYVLDCSFVP